MVREIYNFIATKNKWKATINFSILSLIWLNVGTAKNMCSFFKCMGKNMKYDGQILCMYFI